MQGSEDDRGVFKADRLVQTDEEVGDHLVEPQHHVAHQRGNTRPSPGASKAGGAEVDDEQIRVSELSEMFLVDGLARQIQDLFGGKGRGAVEHAIAVVLARLA